MASETRYFRSDTHTINSLLAKKLLTSRSGTLGSLVCTLGGGAEPDGSISASIYIRHSNGSETTIAEGVAGRSTYPGPGTWSCPQTALSAGDAIKVVLTIDMADVYEEVGPASASATFITEQLVDATQLDAATWSFYYYAEWTGFDQITLRFDTATYNTRIANFTYSGASAATVELGGIGATGSLGEITVTVPAVVELDGIGAIGALGEIQVSDGQPATVNLDGIGAQAALGEVTVLIPSFEDFTATDYAGPRGVYGVYDPADRYNANTQTWQASHAYIRQGLSIAMLGYVDDSVYPSTPVYGTFNGDQIPLYFRCKTPGTAGGSEPTWNTTIYGETTDGTVVWQSFPIYDFITSVTPLWVEWTDMRVGTSDEDWDEWPPGPDAMAAVYGTVNKVTASYFIHQFVINISEFSGGIGAWGLPHKIEFYGINGTLVWGILDEEYNEGWTPKYTYYLELRTNPHTGSGTCYCINAVEFIDDATWLETYVADVIPLTLDQDFYFVVRHTNEGIGGKLYFEAYSDEARTTLIDSIPIDLPSDFTLNGGGGYVWSITAKAPEKKSSGRFGKLTYGTAAPATVSLDGIGAKAALGELEVTAGQPYAAVELDGIGAQAALGPIEVAVPTPSGGTCDLSGIEATLAEIQATLAEIKAKTDNLPADPASQASVDMLLDDTAFLIACIVNKKEIKKIGGYWYLVIYDDAGGPGEILRKELKDKSGLPITDITAGIMAQELASSA